jgi:ATP-dependent DNA helicase RecG
LSQSTVHCGRFKQETIIIDDKMIRGTALEQVEEVMDFIRKSSNLPMPVFDEKFGGFLVIFRKDIYTEENLRKLGVNERQIKAVMCVKEKGSIHLSSFKNIVPEVSEKTLYRDLQNLVNKRVLKELGEKKGR